jgi:RNA polymerase sigma-70 factor (ECF subfamily)
LLKRLINADENAFREIFDLYVHKIYQFVYGYVKEKSESEDITQMVFLKIWENKTTINLNKSFSGFIFTIAYHSIMDYFRKNAARFQQYPISVSTEETFVSHLTAEDSINKHQFDSFYERALQTLPPKRKEIFILSRHNGLSNKQIASHLGLSIKTVENQMTAALFSLKEFLKISELSLIPLFFLFIF